MKKLILLSAAFSIAFASCQNKQVENKDQKLSEQAIAIHDEIMPQISQFDKTTIKIDSIISNLATIKATKADLDTAKTRVDLTNLKDSIENATDHMMTWMKDYDAMNEDEAYQQKEVDKISAMKNQFDRVSEQIKTSLAAFN
ncbi:MULTISPECIES: transposase [Sphingobacterium]|uniref:transposase n=1 Tax=Sphingobacterium TaxID=28453 RepID=UPI0016285B81|nr:MULTISPECIES: transposase [Sphingobacterium]